MIEGGRAEEDGIADSLSQLLDDTEADFDQAVTDLADHVPGETQLDGNIKRALATTLESRREEHEARAREPRPDETYGAIIEDDRARRARLYFKHRRKIIQDLVDGRIHPETADAEYAELNQAFKIQRPISITEDLLKKLRDLSGSTEQPDA